MYCIIQKVVIFVLSIKQKLSGAVRRKRKKMTTSTYKESEDILKAKGFIYECGMPLTGVMFKSETHYAFLWRNSANSYKTEFYEITGQD